MTGMDSVVRKGLGNENRAYAPCARRARSTVNRTQPAMQRRSTRLHNGFDVSRSQNALKSCTHAETDNPRTAACSGQEDLAVSAAKIEKNVVICNIRQLKESLQNIVAAGIERCERRRTRNAARRHGL